MAIMLKWNALIGIFVAVWVPCGALADPLRMTGQGEATADDDLSACEAAKRRALRDVIERSGGVRVRSRTRILQEHPADEEIEITGAGVVNDVRIERIDKHPVSGTKRVLCVLTLSAVVLPEDENLSAAPRVAWCFSGGSNGWNNEIKLALRAAMKEHGWSVHDNESRCHVRVQIDAVMDAPEVNTIANAGGEAMALHRRSGEITLTSTSLREGRMLGDPFVRLSAVRFTDVSALNALRARSVAWAMDRLEGVAQNYDGDLFPESDIVFTISNVPDYGWVSWVRAEMKRRVRMLDSVQVVSYREGSAVLRARALGGAHDVASIMGEAKSLRRVMRVVHVSGGKIDLKFIAKARRD